MENKSIVQLITEHFSDLDEDKELEQIIENIKNDIDVKRKVDNIGLFFETIDSIIEAKENRIKKLKEQLEKLKNKKERFREFLREFLESHGIKEIRGNEFKISVVERGFKVIVDDQEKLPDDFKKVTVVIKPDLEKIADYIRNTGEVPEGVHTEPVKYLQVK